MRVSAVAAVLWLAACLAVASGAMAGPGPGDGRRDRPARAYVVEVDGVRRGEYAADVPLPPASLTKMMTGLLAAERGELQREITISARAAAATGSRLGLRVGERWRAGDLLSATLIASANDACRALAEWLAGSEPAFVVRMNARARQMKLRGTHFVNACGHDAKGHVSTAADLAIIARAAMAQPEYARRAGMAAAEVVSKAGRRLPLTNHNQLIGRFPGAYGVKSGFTAQAGKCLAAMARRDGHEALLVMLDAPNRWWDADALLDTALRRVAAQAAP